MDVRQRITTLLRSYSSLSTSRLAATFGLCSEDICELLDPEPHIFTRIDNNWLLVDKSSKDLVFNKPAKFIEEHFFDEYEQQKGTPEPLRNVK